MGYCLATLLRYNLRPLAAPLFQAATSLPPAALLIFAANQVIADIHIAITNDPGVEPLESFTLGLHTPSGGYSIEAGQGSSILTILDNDLVTADDNYLVLENEILSAGPFQASWGLLDNDYTLAGDWITLSMINGNPLYPGVQIVLASGAVLAAHEDGSFTYMPPYGFSGNDSFAYTATLGSQNALAIAHIIVSPVNQAPAVTVPRKARGDENTDVAIDDVSVSDEDAGIQDIQIAFGADHGTIKVNTSVPGGVTPSQVSGNGTSSVVITAPQAAINATLGSASGLIYHGVLAFHGHDTLSVEVNDLGNTGQGGPLADSGTVAITVLNASGDVEAVDDFASTVINQAVTISPLGNDEDSNDDPLAITAINGFGFTLEDPIPLFSGGTVTVHANGTLVLRRRWTPPQGPMPLDIRCPTKAATPTRRR